MALIMAYTRFERTGDNPSSRHKCAQRRNQDNHFVRLFVQLLVVCIGIYIVYWVDRRLLLREKDQWTASYCKEHWRPSGTISSHVMGLGYRLNLILEPRRSTEKEIPIQSRQPKECIISVLFESSIFGVLFSRCGR